MGFWQERNSYLYFVVSTFPSRLLDRNSMEFLHADMVPEIPEQSASVFVVRTIGTLFGVWVFVVGTRPVASVETEIMPLGHAIAVVTPVNTGYVP